MGFPTDIHPPGTEEIKLNMPDHGTNEREEGEISDDFEDIISSDEEFSMRKRIEELEARNLELEKIATISGTYNNDLVYPNETQKGGTIELEEVSDVEEYSPTFYDKTIRPTTIPYLPQKIKEPATGAWEKAARYTIKKTYSNLPSIEIEIVNNKVKTKPKARKRKREKVSRSKGVVKKHKVKKKIPRLSHTSSDENDFHLDRNELRLALKHDIQTPNNKNKGNLKNIVEERFTDTYNAKALKIEGVKNTEYNEMAIVNEDQDDDDRESTNSLEENELRLIALKSAFCKKHLERKRRKETEDCKPYSPTEFLNLVDVPCKDVVSLSNSLEDVDYENNAMDISPITSPEYEDSADCILKPTDMDLASSSSGTSPVYVLESNWEKYQNIPCPPSWSTHVLEEGNVCVIEEDNSTVDTFNEDENRFPPMQPVPDENDVVRICHPTASVEDSEEEEEALRALLLAKMTSPRVKKDLPPQEIDSTVVRNEKDISSVDELHFQDLTIEARKNNNNDALSSKSEPTVSDHDNSIDLDSLRNFLISNMKKKPVSKTELVLKEAVKRLRIQTQGLDDTTECKQDQSLETTETENSNSVYYDVQLLDTSTCSANDVRHNNSLNDIELDEMPRSLSRTSQEVTYQRELDESENINPIEIPEISTQVEKTIEEVNIPCAESVNVEVSDCTEVAENYTMPSAAAVPKTPPIIECVKHSTVSEKLVEKEEEKHIRKPLKTIIKNSAKPSTKVVRRTSMIQSKLSPALKKTASAIVPKLSTISKTKIINHNSIVTIKTMPNVIMPKPVKTTTIQNINKPSRLVTSLDTTRKVQKIIINVGQTDSESDDAELYSNFNADCTRNMLENDDYCDNASPQSIQMDSPCYSPVPITKLNDRVEISPLAIERTTEPREIKKVISDKKTVAGTKIVAVNDIFQSKLDEFLKNVRNKCETGKKEDVGKKQTLSETPVAVRHLPLSSQLEYRRLVNRMKMLEKQKVAKQKKDTNNCNPVQNEVPSNEVVSDKPKEIEEICENPVNTGNVDSITQTTNENVNNMNEREIEEKSKAVIEPSNISNMIKDNNETKITSQAHDDNTTNNARKLEKYETEYKQTSASLLRKIKATIDMVHHAKQEKLKKFMLENELKQLKQQLMEVEKNLQIQTKVISEIYPEICESSKTIVRLRKRHNLLFKASNNLGKNVKGKEYKLDKEYTKIIADKSHELASEIKNLKLLKRSSSRLDSESEKKENLSEDLESSKQNERTSSLDDNKVTKSPEDVAQNKIDHCQFGEQIESLPSENIPVTVSCSVEAITVDKKVEDATVNASIEKENADKSAEPTETTENYIKMEVVETGVNSEVTNLMQSSDIEEITETTTEADGSMHVEEVDNFEINKFTEPPKELKPDLSVKSMQDTQPIGSVDENLKREPVHSKVLEEYVSPLDHSKIERNVDPHGIICPYQLMGQCDDKECKFVHLPSIV